MEINDLVIYDTALIRTLNNKREYEEIEVVLVLLSRWRQMWVAKDGTVRNIFWDNQDIGDGALKIIMPSPLRSLTLDCNEEGTRRCLGCKNWRDYLSIPRIAEKVMVKGEKCQEYDYCVERIMCSEIFETDCKGNRELMKQRLTMKKPHVLLDTLRFDLSFQGSFDSGLYNKPIWMLITRRVCPGIQTRGSLNNVNK